MEVNPKLLAFLDKLVHPIDRVEYGLEVMGLFCFPDEWRTADEAMPGIFTYHTKFAGVDIMSGKIIQREQTEKELKEIEEALAAKKNKGKKDPKAVEPVLTQEEIERQRKHQEEVEEEERRKQAEWDALDEKTKFFRTYEDKYKHPSIQWEKHAGSVEKSAQDLVIFEERVYNDGGDWLYFVKQPSQTEEELVKLRKSKPKGLNLNDLYPVAAKTWVDYKCFQEPGCRESVQRCFLELAPSEEHPEAGRPNLEKTYLLIKITLNPPITPLILDIQPKPSDLIPKPQPIQKDPPSVECVKEFRSDLVVIMESLAMEYANMFGKELNAAQDQRAKNTLTVQKKAEINKRKEQFLYDFNVSGKYKILKERLKKSIVKICRDKFQKQGSITGITTETKDQFYSELYVFLIEQMRKTLGDIIHSKREDLHEDIVISYDQTVKERDRILSNLRKETPEETMIKLANEYELLNSIEMAEKNLQNLLALDKKNPKNCFHYSKFCLRQKIFSKAEETLQDALTYDPENKEYQLLMAALLVKRSRFKEALVFMHGLLQGDQLNILYNTFTSFIYTYYMAEEKLGKKFMVVSQRLYMRNLGILPPKETHKTNPNPFELPNFKQLNLNMSDNIKKGPTLSTEQIDDIWMELVEYLSKNQLFDLVQKLLDQISDKTTQRVMIVRSHIETSKGNYPEALNILNTLLESNPKNYDVLVLKANLCFLSDKYYECEETFFKALKIKSSNATNNFQAFLRLGYIYLKRKSWADAKAIFIKTCEIKSNSSLAWLGLGIGSQRIRDFKDAEEALTQANIYDPFNSDTWGYLALLCLQDGNRFVQANQALREMFKTDIESLEILEEIGDELSRINKYETAEICYSKLISVSREKFNKQYGNIGDVYAKLGKIYHSQNNLEKAREAFENSMQFLESENEKAKIRGMMENLRENEEYFDNYNNY